MFFFNKKLYEEIALLKIANNDLQKEIDNLKTRNMIVDPPCFCKSDEAISLAHKALDHSKMLEYELKSDKDISMIYSALQNTKLEKIVISESQVKVGKTFDIEVHLENRCEFSNVTILLEADDSSFIIPKFLTIPKNTKAKTFTIDCSKKPEAVHVTISASLNNITKLEMIEVVE